MTLNDQIAELELKRDSIDREISALRSGKFPASHDCSCTSFQSPTSVLISGLINDYGIGNGTYVKLVDVIDFIREHHEHVVGPDAMVVMLQAKFGSGHVTTMRVTDAAKGSER